MPLHQDLQLNPYTLTLAVCSNIYALLSVPGVPKLFVPGTPDAVKEKSGTPRKRNLENTQPASEVVTEKKVHSTA
jgi:hypothetical protein